MLKMFGLYEVMFCFDEVWVDVDDVGDFLCE